MMVRSCVAWMTAGSLVLAVSAHPAAAAAGLAQAQGGQAQAAQAQAAQAAGASEGPQASSIVDMSRIRRAVQREPALDLSTSGLRFYALITAPELDTSKILGGDNYDLIYGATRGGAAMTHDEFLAMVTPKELYGSGGIKPRELLEWSLINMVGQALVKKLIEDLRTARTERERREIREQIERELALLRGRSGGGGDGRW
jgi:hypothetical protein